MSKTARLSPKAILDHIAIKMEALEAHYGFDGSDGWAQVAGKGEQANRAYGEYAALRQLAENISDRNLRSAS